MMGKLSKLVRRFRARSASGIDDIGQMTVSLRKMIWANVSLRAYLQQHGVNIVPCNFYSNIPSVAEIESSYEYTGSAPYLGSGIFNNDEMCRLLSDLVRHAQDFDPPQEGDENTCRRYYWKNSQFSYSDAMSYYAFIRYVRPKRVVEIGGGFSTLVAADAIGRNESGMLTCIEPYPRPFLTNGTIPMLELIQIKAQELDAAQLNLLLNDGDILFIDSTHTVKTGSDCLHLYLRLLPALRRNVFIHVHDVFLPFGMPKHWLMEHQIYWTEQYLLLAWILDNPRASVLYGSAYHNTFNPDMLDSLMHGRYPRGGGSFWLEYRGAR